MKDLDFICIGAGPSGLSLGALSSTVPGLKGKILERKSNFEWHGGMLIPDAKMQISYLKDLVTLVDATNPFSFVNYLSVNNRLYQFITANFGSVNREEYSDYLSWVLSSLDNVEQDTLVREVDYKNGWLEIETDKEKYRTNNLVLSTGLSPVIPEVFDDQLKVDKNSLFSSSEYMYKSHDFSGKTVSVIGSGQSGAEIFLDLINQKTNAPEKINWITESDNIFQLDDSPFVNEIFNPGFAEYFYNSSEEEKKQLLSTYNFANNGVSEQTLVEIYQSLYKERYIKKEAKTRSNLLIGHTLKKVYKDNKQYVLEMRTKEETKKITSDVVIFCTGYKYKTPSYLEKIKCLFNRDEDNFLINSDYSVNWKHQDECSVYIQNGAIHTHGLSDPNLSLSSRRSAIIINSIIGYDFYKDLNAHSFIF
ncbi:lysine N(6)-hydroxylase/L-ornithine N(5)-oxygenase family protein [Aquimarina hainanensis]|uniref:Lysine N(6)-hydroxylase/L-ornithine N(5)-oxygenase family protein n=1 Tax=Aquimarina hainanensis TaxID=1578017 RepID=A0ABW5N277_9FLAO